MTLWLLLPLASLALLSGAWRGRAARKRWAGDLAALLALLLLCAGATADTPVKGKGASGPALALVVDVSASMAAADGELARLALARRELRTLVSLLPAARFALIPFAGAATVQVPLGSDGDALLFFIDQLTPGQVAAPGSAPEEALALAAEVLKSATGEKAIVLFSDGERTLPERPPQLPVGLPIYVVPSGTLAGAALPGNDDTPRRDDRGEVIVTRLDGERLQRFASAGGGAILPLGAEPAVTPLLRRWGASAPPDPTCFAGLLAAVAFGLLLLRQLPAWPRRRLALISLCLFAACQGNELPSGELAFAQALRLHESGKVDAAATAFADAARLLEGEARASALFNQGTLLVHQNRGEEALPLLEQALLLLPGDDDVRGNFILALRAVGAERGGGFGEGQRSSPGAGSGELSREEALQLLEGVKAAPAAPVGDTVQLRETAVARDW